MVQSHVKTPLKTLPSEDNDADENPGEQDLSTIIPTKPSPSTVLPPVGSDEKITVQKKRKLQLVADEDESSDKLIPSKSRSTSLSTEIRTPSLNMISQPVLSPPESNLSYRSFEESTPEIRRVSTPSTLHHSTAISPSKPEKTGTTLTPKQTLSELRRKESKLDSEIKQARSKLETLKRAKNILTKNESADNADQIAKWRDAAQRASNYLLNAAIDKVSKTGGKRELVKKEKERLRETIEHSVDNSFQDRIHEVTNSEEYSRLSEREQERILDDLEKEQEKAMEELERTFIEEEDKSDRNGNNDDDDDEFTMKDLYKRLKLDYNLVFAPEN